MNCRSWSTRGEGRVGRPVAPHDRELGLGSLQVLRAWPGRVPGPHRGGRSDLRRTATDQASQSAFGLAEFEIGRGGRLGPEPARLLRFRAGPARRSRLRARRARGSRFRSGPARRSLCRCRCRIPDLDGRGATSRRASTGRSASTVRRVGRSASTRRRLGRVAGPDPPPSANRLCHVSSRYTVTRAGEPSASAPCRD